MEKRPGFVGPLLLITIGFILLFNKMELIHWGSLWHYWPVILILWGIEILAINTGSDVGYFMALFLCILVIIATVWLASNGYPLPDKKGDNLRGIIFTNKYLENKEFNFADLDYADFNNSNLDGANMNFVSLQYANLSNSSLNGANLNFADLAFADLRNSVLDGANLNFVDLEGANMAGARLNGANHVFAGTSKSTICPDSTNGPCW
jgi:hypothetical protein